MKTALLLSIVDNFSGGRDDVGVRNVEADPARVVGVDTLARRCPDLSHLRALTGYEPTVALEEGVRRAFDWYRESWPR